MTNQEKFLAYLDAYAAKNIAQVADMFSENITLRDWKIFVRGKAKAVAETQFNFQSAKTIEIQTLQLYETQGGVAGELRILVDGDTELFVVDVLDFDEAGKISAIRAFLGRGDE